MNVFSSSKAPSRGFTIAYWVTTLVVASEMALGGVWDLLQISYVRNVIEHLGYPTYFLLILGAWKIPCSIALLAPRFARLKEWAYAGAFFNYTGAVASHLSVGDGAAKWAMPLAYTVLTLASWALRPADRRELNNSPLFLQATIIYWITTAILAIECFVGGVMGALRVAPFLAIMNHLGYPAYLMTILGISYLLAGIAILLPRFPRAKEWAYAGLIFIYTGAAASRLIAGDGAETIAGPFIFSALVFASWALRPPSRYT
jgi:uncharacterized membrane protein YphA (DoxX/SURF4 family)